MKPTLTPARAKAALAAAAAIFEITPAALTGPRGGPRIVTARHIAQAALFEACDVTYVELGRLFDRHHTTVMYGCDKARLLAATNAEYAAALALIAQEVRAA